MQLSDAFPVTLGDYAFRRVVAADLALLHAWLSEPHVRAWWGDPDHERTLIADSLDLDRFVPLIVSHRGAPFAYMQVYDIFSEVYAPYPDQPRGSLAIDPFIGVAGMIGKGHGTALLRAVCDHLFRHGATRILIDPDPDNARAIAAYRKASFVSLGLRETEEDGICLLMARYPPQR